MGNVISKIEIEEETQDVTFFFVDSEEPFSSGEFILDARKRLRAIEEAIHVFNQQGRGDPGAGDGRMSKREWRPLLNGEYPPPGPTKYGPVELRDGQRVRPILVFAPVIRARETA